MRYEVLITQGAERDLEEIYDHIAEFDSPEKAEYVLSRLLEVAERLATSLIAARTRKNCRHSASGNIARPTSSRIGSSIA